MNEKLELTPEEMRRLGYQAVDAIVERLAGLPEAAVGRKGSRTQLETLLREPLPEQGADPAEVLQFAVREIFPYTMAVNHPRFFAFVPSPGNFVGVVADALSSGFNSFLGTWFAGSGPAEVELVTLDWLRQICGLPESAGGLFVSGGSMANLTALAVARQVKLGERFENGVVYYSDQTHSSVERALRVLGFAAAQIRRLPSDENFRLPPGSLRAAVAEDRAAGRKPFCVVANAGTTNTGAVDPLPELAGYCRGEDLWLHADGAFGAAAMLSEKGRALLRGLEEADSLSLDPHKWLFQPFEIGCVLLREERWLTETYRILPEYLRDVHRFAEEVNFCDRGVQLTRNFRALKLWMSFKTFGVGSFRRAVERGLSLAETAERELRRRACFTIITPAQLGTVCFRYSPAGASEAQADALNQRLVDAMLADGYAILTSTVLRGRPVLRLCTINPRTTDEEVAETVRRLERLAGAPA